MAPDSTQWPLEPHTAAKHEILRRYLNAWFPILGTYNGRVVFLDGFAGPGIYSRGEPGSPIVALRSLLEHSSLPRLKCEFIFWFLEPQDDRFESLEAQFELFKQRHGGLPPNVKVKLEQTTFEAAATATVGYLEQQKRRLAPTFAFIDPFGFSGAPLELLGSLLAFDHCEVFFTFIYNNVNRFLLEEGVSHHLDTLFGTRDYVQAGGLSGQSRKQFLHDLYERQLREHCGFTYVRSFEMVDRSGHTAYFLFHGTRSLTGLRAMKEAMWKVDVGGGIRFSERFAGQEVLFSRDAIDVTPLRAALLERFAGRSASIEDIEAFVLADTPFSASHYKTAVLRELEQAGVIRVLTQRARRFSYPAGTRIMFPT
jgi:three-Cys-motif partner protein